MISNFLESKEQSRVSKLGGQMFTAKTDEGEDADGSVQSTSLSLIGFKENFMKLVLPAAGTMFCGTFTYPIAVRIARRVFRLRGFYAIHISIAPFLALLHVNIFASMHTLGRIKVLE